MEQALGCMVSICANNGHVYEADFFKSKVKELDFDYYDDPFPYSEEYELEERLRKMQASKN